MLKNKSSKAFYSLFIILIALFCYLRLKPIYFQTVGYTYDQGRDFLKTAEVFLYKNPTFIGPTTGIMGIYHGAWWYYLLGIPFFIFKGLPIGFYYFNFFIHLLTLIAATFFVKKYFDAVTALIVATLLTISPYFNFTSLFVGNNIITIPILALFSGINFLLLESKIKNKKLPVFLLLNGLLLGLVMEFEFAFGLFLIPAYFILTLAFKPLRNIFLHLKNSFFFSVGLGASLSLRILFELKHSFPQTRTLLSFFFKPKLYNPKPYLDVVRDRYQLFLGYYKSIFPNEILALAFIAILIALIIITLKNKTKFYKKSLLFFSLLIVILYLFSTFYKDNFWSNYYEGIHFIFLMIIAIVLSVNLKPAHIVRYLFLTVLLIFSLTTLISNIKTKLKYEGLQVQAAAVNYVLANEKVDDKFCVKVYTPPVIPYTYDYLFLYNKLVGKTLYDPAKDWVNNKCWFIIEHDEYKFREEKWIEENVPKNSKTISQFLFKDIVIQLKNRSY